MRADTQFVVSVCRVPIPCHHSYVSARLFHASTDRQGRLVWHATDYRGPARRGKNVAMHDAIDLAMTFRCDAVSGIHHGSRLELGEDN